MSITDRDPGDETNALFDAAATAPKKCPSCGTTRKNLCDHDAAFHTTPFAERPLRPRGCLNTGQLSHNESLPY